MSARLREWAATKLLEWSGRFADLAQDVCPEMFTVEGPYGIREAFDIDDDVINPRVNDDEGELPF